MFTEV
ncbi:hypothetical protein VTH82DRAFT_6622 [Thermothelomyces myriococcoides]